MRRAITCLGTSLALFAGCQAKPDPVGGTPISAKPPAGFAPPGSTLAAIVPNSDPSAVKMQDIGGAVLNYYLVYKRLPAEFGQIKSVADIDVPVDQACPGSPLPYVYTADGIKLQDREARIILYEPAPLHHGYRLAIIFSEPKDNHPLMTDLIALPESFFLLHPPAVSENAKAAAPR